MRYSSCWGVTLWKCVVLVCTGLLVLAGAAAAGVSVHPVMIDDPAAVVGRQYAIHVRNGLEHQLPVELVLGWGTAKDGGQLQIDWSPTAAQAAAAVISLDQEELLLTAHGEGRVQIRLDALPMGQAGYPVLAVCIRQRGVAARLAVPILVQEPERQADLRLEDMIWQEGLLMLSVTNHGDGFDQFRGQMLFDDEHGGFLAAHSAEGYVFPGQTRHWILDAPAQALSLSVETTGGVLGHMDRPHGY